MTRWLILGAGGMLGRDLAELVRGHGDAPITCTHSDLDVTREADVHTVIRRCRPDVVVNCAAWTAVDAAERDEPAALAVNGHGAGHVAAACAVTGARLIHVSTDYVFGGGTGRPHAEHDGISETAGGISGAGAGRLGAVGVATATAPGVPRPRAAPGGRPRYACWRPCGGSGHANGTNWLTTSHQGAIQDIAAATLSLHRLDTGTRPELAGQVGEIGQLLDQAARSLRRLMDGQWPSLRDHGPFLRAEDWLTGALRERTGWLLATPMAVNVSGPSAGLGAAEVPRVVDVAELMLFAMTGGNLPAEATATVDVEYRQVTVALTIAQPAAGDAGAALTELAAALGAGVRTEFFPGRWQAVIEVPRQFGD